MSNTYRKNISKYLEVQQHELQLAESRGQSDAKLGNVDNSSNEMPGFMQETISSAKGMWASYETAHSSYQDELSQQKSTDEYQVSNGIPQEIKNLEEQKRDAEQLFETKEGRNSSEYEKIEEDLKIAKDDYERIRAELNRPLLTKFEKVYMPFLAILALAEVPINRQAFELFFSEAPAVILVLALATGIMLVFFAHSLGHLIKENSGPENKSKMSAQTIAGISAILAVTAVLMYFLAVMRQSYANVSKGADETFGELFSDGQTLELFQDSLFQPLSGEGISLLVLNFSIYFAGILASFFRHDANPNYEKITKTFNKLRDKMASKKEKIERHLSEIQATHNKKMEALGNRRQNLLQNIQSMQDELVRIKSEKESDYKTVIANINTILKAYEKGYLNASDKNSNTKFFMGSYSNKIKAELDS